MNAQTDQLPADLRPKAPRLRPALADAIRYIVEEGRTQREAASRAGMDESALGRALKRPQVAVYVETLKALQALDADKLKAQARKIAIREGLRLMMDAKSEQVRARMVEFFAGEQRQAVGNTVNISIPQDRSGYVFAPPKDVTPDAQSPVTIEQAPDNKGE